MLVVKVLIFHFMIIDTGLSKAANEEHARDLPIMNGIKEDIKTVGVLDSGSPDYLEALYNISSRLKKLQVNSALFKLIAWPTEDLSTKKLHAKKKKTI